ncbi:Hypothetical protein D9617_1g087000 [Elsinoe fawcettii]|nr:Hypothetical protein D9617_1g087000 [Elsinoe fawcettii]
MAQGWRSTRLVYIAVEEAHEPVLLRINQNWNSYVNSTPFIPVPQSKAGAKSFREWLGSCLMGALVCLPGKSKEDKATATPDASLADLTPIGMVSLTGANPRELHHRNASVAVSLLPEYQGQGYGTEALGWLFEFAFQHANLHRLGIGAFGYNERAIQLYKRLGFIEEGRRREALWHNGKYWDHVDMGMLRSEWEELRRLDGKEVSR